MHRLAKLVAIVLALAPAAAAAKERPLPDVLFGVTLDEVANLTDQLVALRELPVMPVARVVFDDVAAGYYHAPLGELKRVAYVMGELVDSSGVKDMTNAAYLARTKEYFAALEDRVDIWEIGNEINGQWLGRTSDVVIKMSQSYRYVKSRGGRTALTLFYNETCAYDRAHEMFTWAKTNVPADMKAGLDYVLISWYPYGCNNAKPDWRSVFRRLGAIFPNAKLGFGEVGIAGKATRSQKADLVREFYGLPRLGRNYVGGYFWWYFAEDMVPATRPLWRVLSDAIATSPL
jgi:hypothetical protein